MASRDSFAWLFDWLLPTRGRDDATLRFRAELVMGFGAFELLATAVFSIGELTLGTPAIGAIYALSLAPMLAILVWARGGGDATRAGSAFMTVLFLSITAVNIGAGGQAIGANIALPTAVLFGVLMSSPRVGLVWTGLIVVEIIIVANLRTSGYDFPIKPNMRWVGHAIDRVPLFLSLVSALIGVVILRALGHFRTHLEQARATESAAREVAAFNAARFTDFAEIAADGFWETDADLRLTYVSPSFAAAMGLDREQMIGLTPEQAYRLRFPDLPDLSAYAAPLRDRQPFGGQLLHMVNRAGFKRLLLNQGLPIHDRKGEFIGYRGVVQDVTEQRKTEKALRENEKRLRSITENIPAVIAYLDHEERYRFCNGLVGKVLGVDNEAVIGRSMREVRGEQIYAGLAAHVAAALRGEPVTFEGEGEFENRHRYFQTNYIPDITADGEILGFYAITFDVTQIKESEIALADVARRLQLITDHLPAFIVHVDVDERYTFANAYTGATMAVDPSTIVGKRISEVLEPKYYAEIKPHVDAALRGETQRFEIVREYDGKPHSLHSTYVPDVDGSGKVVGFFVMSADITQLKRIENELRMLTQIDSLTGLANRTRFNTVLAEAIARSERSGKTMALAFLDLDRFKSINDSLGHMAGDLVLQEFARRLNLCTRQTDTVARLAGDEFVIVLEGLPAPEGAVIVANKILAEMAHPFDILDQQRVLSTSIGIASRRNGELDGELLLRRADEALYAAKTGGRATFRIAE